MTVEFYPNKLSETAPLGTWKTDRRMTIEQWLKEQSSSYERRESPPISIVLNDEVIEQRLWHKVPFKPSDLLQIYREPKGTDPFSITFALFKGAKAALKSLMPKMPGMPSNAGTQQGDPIAEASAKGNKVKLGEPVRQIAGHQRIYGSYLTQPRRAYVAPRDQRVEMLLYIGEGECDIPLSKVKVGETPLISLGSDAVFTIYPPGADLSADPAHINWFNAPEVGASSSGSAGLELTMATDLTRSVTASAYQFNGNTISIPLGAGTFPADWVAGLVIRVLSPYEYTVADGGAGRDIIRGPLEMLNPAIATQIEVQGANSGLYVVSSYTPASPTVPPTAGAPSTVLASSAPARYDYNVTPVTFLVGGGSILNRVIDTYSWLGASLPAVNKSADINVSLLALSASASGHAYRCDTTTTATGGYVRLNPTSGAGSSYLEPGTYRVSVYASSALAGATLQCGVYDGTTNVTGAVQAITSTRARYVFTITIATAMNASLVAYVNRAGIAGNTLIIDSPMI